MQTRFGRRSHVAAAALVLVAVAGCSSDDDDAAEPRFAVSDLAPGACTELGEDLLEVETSQRRLAAERIGAEDAAQEYGAIQNRLLGGRDEASQEVASSFRRLVTALGSFRSGVAGDELGDKQVDRLRTALDETLSACGVRLG